MPKIICLALTALLTVSSLLITSVHSEVTKPSIPDFTTRLVDNSYDVLTTYSTDPYTGSTITHPAHRVTNQSVELVIKKSAICLHHHWRLEYFALLQCPHEGALWRRLANPLQPNRHPLLCSTGLREYRNISPLLGFRLSSVCGAPQRASSERSNRFSSPSAYRLCP